MIGLFEKARQLIDPATIQINFNADRYSIEEGECTTLHWRVTGAETVAVQGDEVEHAAGRETCPESDQIYRLVAENETNQKQSSFEIEVTEPVRDQPEPTPCTPTPENDYCDVPF